MGDNEYQNKIKKWKEEVMLIVVQKQLSSVMNDTKWSELQNAVRELPFPPAFWLKLVTDKDESAEENFNEDGPGWGDWSDESLKPFWKIEWMKVRPRYLKYRGRLVAPEIIDETKQFVAILKKFNIPYKEEKDAFIIYGYY